MASKKRRGSTPSPSARATVSARLSTSETIHAFSTSFSRLLAPASSPTSIVLAATASNTGASRSLASRGPEASTVSLPSSAGLRVPSTGPSTHAASPAAAPRPAKPRRDRAAPRRQGDAALGAVARLGRRVRHARAEPLGLLARPVPHTHVVAGLRDVAGHGRAHGPRPYDRDAHQ